MEDRVNVLSESTAYAAAYLNDSFDLLEKVPAEDRTRVIERMLGEAFRGTPARITPPVMLVDSDDGHTHIYLRGKWAARAHTPTSEVPFYYVVGDPDCPMLGSQESLIEYVQGAMTAA